MKRIHNLKRTIALFLAMLMAATSTAFANWDSFQGDDLNNGKSDTGVTALSGTPVTIDLPNNGAFTGVDTEPLVFGSRVYALYNGGSTSGGDAKDFTDGKVGGARVAAADASTGKLLWSVQVGEADNVSQIATPVLSKDGKTLYGAYTYTKNIFPTGFETRTIDAGGSDSVTYTDIELTGSFSNFQVTTGIMGTGKQTGTVEIRKHSDKEGTPGALVQTVTSDSYDGYSFSIYYTDGTAIPEGNYDITVTVQNNGTASVTWDQCQFLLNYWQAFKVTGINTGSPVAADLKASGSGQASTPFTIYETLIDEVIGESKLYFGIFDGDRAYYQYDTKSDTLEKFTPGNNDQFYYAGAVVHGGRVYFGSESGTVYIRHTDKFAENGTEVEVADVAIRSSIVLEPFSLGEIVNGRDLYFTSRNGKLWRARLDGDTLDSKQELDLGTAPEEEHSTATPTISGNNVYVTTYGSNPTTWADIGTVKRVAKDFDEDTELTEENTIYKGDGVQCSPVVYRDRNVDYVYFTTNVSNGTGYCYNTNATNEPVWKAESGNYALQGFAMGGSGRDSFAVFGNDGCQLLIVKTGR